MKGYSMDTLKSCRSRIAAPVAVLAIMACGAARAAFPVIGSASGPQVILTITNPCLDIGGGDRASDEDLVRKLEQLSGAAPGPDQTVGTLVPQILERPLRPGDFVYSLSPAAAIPLMMCRWKMRKITITGMVQITLADSVSPYSAKYEV